MFLTIVLFVVAYILLVAAVCVTLKRATQRIEEDYPLTSPPDMELTQPSTKPDVSRSRI